MDALFWIKNTKKRRKVFVENRTKKIRERIGPEKWRYCPSELNPADIASRGVKQVNQVASEFRKWITAPKFLCQSRDTWPKDLSNNDGERIIASEQHDIRVNCTYEPNVEVVCLYMTDEVTQKSIKRVRVQPKRIRIDQILPPER